jgi:hypothetical protein
VTLLHVLQILVSSLVRAEGAWCRHRPGARHRQTTSQESLSSSSSGAQSGPRFTSRRRRSAALAIFISRPLGEGGESGAVRPPIAALVATSRTHPLPPRAAFCYRCVHSRVRHRPTDRRSFAFRPAVSRPTAADGHARTQRQLH